MPGITTCMLKMVYVMKLSSVYTAILSVSKMSKIADRSVEISQIQHALLVPTGNQ